MADSQELIERSRKIMERLIDGRDIEEDAEADGDKGKVQGKGKGRDPTCS